MCQEVTFDGQCGYVALLLGRFNREISHAWSTRIPTTPLINIFSKPQTLWRFLKGISLLLHLRP